MKFFAFFLLALLAVAAARPKKCDRACKRIYMPVCGIRKDGTQCTFANRCLLQVANCQTNNSWSRWAKGACKKNSKSCKM